MNTFQEKAGREKKLGKLVSRADLDFQIRYNNNITRFLPEYRTTGNALFYTATNHPELLSQCRFALTKQ